MCENLLNKNLQYIKGIGPKKSILLEKNLNLKTIKDLLFYFPKRWENRLLDPNFNINNLNFETNKITLLVRVKKTNIFYTKTSLVIFEAIVFDEKNIFSAKWFKKQSKKYDIFYKIKKDITPANKIFIYGEYFQNEIKVLDYEIYDPKNLSINMNRIVPVYSETKTINSKFIRKIIFSAIQYLEENNFFITDFLPIKIIKRNKFLTLFDAIKNIHFPENFDKKNDAYFRLCFNNFFLLEVVLIKQYLDAKNTKKSHKYILHKNLLTPFKNILPFSFTPDQKKAINEIFNDLLSSFPMNRLLQGDVGSGKTIVATCAILLAAENNFEAAFMAPTEVLARQHYENLQNLFAKSEILKNIKIGLLTGSMTKKEKNIFYKNLKENYFNIIIGTHALISENIKFNNLKLIIIDEQHKFGVKARLKLLNKNITKDPDILVMSATPIPRSLAMGLNANMDISIIKTKPIGRKEIKTFVSNLGEALEKLIFEVQNGHQGYIVYPAVNENNKLEIKSAKKMYKKFLSFFNQKNITIGLLHGQMNQKEKDETVSKFFKNDLNVLISTSIIEVGINVPNATVMIIEEAERFGLASLHQMRGRIGRSNYESYCYLIPKEKSQFINERLKVMLKSNDGFYLAEKDLLMRGPGELLGEDQHGFLNLDIGDITKDEKIISLAKNEAKFFWENINSFSIQEINLIKNEILNKFEEKLDFIKI